MRRLTYRVAACAALVLLAGCGGQSTIGTPSEGYYAPTADEASPRELALSTASGGMADLGLTGTGTANALLPLSWLGAAAQTRAAFGTLSETRIRRQRTTATIADTVQSQLGSLPAIPSGTANIDYVDDTTGLRWTGTVRTSPQGVDAQLVGRDGVHTLAAGLQATITNSVAIRVVLGVNGSYALGDQEVTVRMQTELTGTLTNLANMMADMSGRHNAGVEVRNSDGSLAFRSSEAMVLTGYLNGDRAGLSFNGSTSVGQQLGSGVWWVRTQETLNYASTGLTIPSLPNARAEATAGMTLTGHLRCLASNRMTADVTIG